MTVPLKPSDMKLPTGMKPLQNFEISPDSLAFTRGADTRNIKIKHYLCLRHTLPKTRLSKAIMYENVSQTKMLGMEMNVLKQDRSRHMNALDFNQRSFTMTQTKKKQKWKKEDEVTVSNMNLPVLTMTGKDRPASCRVLYHMSEFQASGEQGDKSEARPPVLPNMQFNLRREQTEIVSHREKTFMTKLPDVVEIDPKLLERHNTYCGKAFLDKGEPGRDGRFSKFITMLQPANVRKDDYPHENVKSESRLSRYGVRDNKEKSPRSALTARTTTNKDDIARRFSQITSRENSNLSDTFESEKDMLSKDMLSKYKKTLDSKDKEQRKRFQKKGEIMFERYKSDDVIQLGKAKKKYQDQIPETDETE